MSSCHDKDILNNVIFAFLSEKHLMTIVINMHKPYFHNVMVMKVSCKSYNYDNFWLQIGNQWEMFSFHLLEMFGTAHTQIVTESNFFWRYQIQIRF